MIGIIVGIDSIFYVFDSHGRAVVMSYKNIENDLE